MNDPDSDRYKLMKYPVRIKRCDTRVEYLAIIRSVLPLVLDIERCEPVWDSIIDCLDERAG